MPEIAEASEATQEVPVSLIGEDGNFTENWMEMSGVDEGLREDQTLKSTKNVAGLASQLVNAQKLIGKNADMVVIPTEHSTDVERDEFHKRMGRPDTPDEYEITHLEEIGEIDTETETAFKNLAHSMGMKPADVQKLIALDDARTIGMRKAMDEAQLQKMDDCNKALDEKWGVAREQRLLNANRMIAENVSEENKPHILDAIGSNPYVADFLANIAAKFVEHKIISADIDQPTPDALAAQIEALQQTPGYVTGELSNTSPARYKQITQELQTLYDKKNLGN